MTCTVCGQDCFPRAENAVGVQVEEHSVTLGWLAITKPFASYCLAKQAMNDMDKSGVERRVYTAFAQPS